MEDRDMFGVIASWRWHFLELTYVHGKLSMDSLSMADEVKNVNSTLIS